MTECRKCQGLMIEALYGELGQEDGLFFGAHTSSCPQCGAEFKEMAATLKLMDKRERPDPGAEFWESYMERLSRRLEKMGGEAALSGRESPRSEKRARFFSLAHGWVFQAAGAVALVVIGIIIGRSLLSPPSSVEQARQTPETRPIAPPSIEQAADPVLRAQNYFDRSKLVLLALVNYDSKTDDPYGLDLPRRKQISAELVNEAGYLKGALRDPAQRRLRELVTDLETILIQIANLESEQDLEAVEFVKRGVDSRGILLKINLSEMGRIAPKAKDPDPRSKSPSDKSAF